MGTLPRASRRVPRGWPVQQCPNLHDWLPGDIVLVHAARDVVGLALSAAQAAAGLTLGIEMLRSHCSVTHAGVYVGEGYMVDVTPKRLAEKVSVWTYAQTRKVELRRVPGTSGEEIAKAALSYIGKPYNLRGLISDGFFPGISSEVDSMYCSSLVDLAVREGSGRYLGWVDGCQPVFPATLAGHPYLSPVSIYWMRTPAWQMPGRLATARRRLRK